MSEDTFTEEITVLDEWKTKTEKFRLVNKGMGPDELQVFKNYKWVPETECYVHSILTRRIKELIKERS